MNSVIICDIDGTLANCDHRRHFVEPKVLTEECEPPSMYTDFFYICTDCGFAAGTPHKTDCKLAAARRSWEKFLDPDLVREDTLIEKVAGLVAELSFAYCSRQVVFCTGRNESCRAVTEEWLNNKLPWLPAGWQLMMRADGDFRPDADVKREMLEVIGKERVIYVIDDRKCVVKMWRQEGLFVLDVAGYEG